jgi:hypothetical protein
MWEKKFSPEFPKKNELFKLDTWKVSAMKTATLPELP